MTVEHLVAQYGLVALFAGCFFEGETSAIAGGVLASKGILVLWQVVAVVIGGAFVADMGYFLVSRLFRTSALVRGVLAKPGVARVFAQVERHPRRLAALCRFIPGMRIVGPMVIAQSRIGTATFLAIDLAAAVIWGAFYAVLGQGAARLLGSLLGGPRHHLLIVSGAILGVAFVAHLVWRWHIRSRAAALAAGVIGDAGDVAGPGPRP